MAKRTFSQHWPVIVLAVVVTVIFVAVLVAFAVKETDYAIVMTFGSPRVETVDGQERVKVYDPGLHLKWPLIDTVWRHDRRIQAYELKKGQVEQIQTSDDYQIVVTTFVLWRVGDPGLFLRRVNTTAEAENKLDDVVRNSRNIVLGQHPLSALINVEPDKVRIGDIEREILEHMREVAMSKYGIEVLHLGFKHLGFPEEVSTKVFARMRAERNRRSAQYRAQGQRDAQKIRAQADLQVSNKLAEAQAAAQRIRAAGDGAAAQHYAAFQANPELAAFLRKLDALRKTLSEKTTLIVDTSTPPYDLLLPGATDLLKGAGAGRGSVTPQGDAK